MLPWYSGCCPPPKLSISLNATGSRSSSRCSTPSSRRPRSLSDIAHVKAPIDVIMGDLDEFRSEAVLRIVERMRGVTVRRVRATNHLIGKRLAQIGATKVTTE